jgi:hypothetical protein
MRSISSYTVVPARGTPRRWRRGDPVAGTHNHRLWNMGPQHKRVYARLRRAMRGDDGDVMPRRGSSSYLMALIWLKIASAPISLA